MLRTTPYLAALAVVTVVVACGSPSRSTPPEPPATSAPQRSEKRESPPDTESTGTAVAAAAREIPSHPVARPDDVIAIAVVGNPTRDLANLVAFVDAVKPGLGGMFTPQAVPMALGLPVPAGIDYSKPISVLVLDPMRYPNEFIAIVVGLTRPPNGLAETFEQQNPGLLLVEHNGFAVIGKRGAVDAVAGYALSTVALQPPPPHPLATAYPRELITRYEREIAAAIDTMAAQSGKAATTRESLELMIEAGRQTPEVSFALVADATEVSGVFTMFASPGTTAASIYKGQRPASYARLGSVSRGSRTVLAGGRLDYTGLIDPLTQLSALWAQYGAMGTENMARWFDAFGGEFAMAVNLDLASKAFDVRWTADMQNAAIASSLPEMLETGTIDAATYTRRTGKKLRYKGARLLEYKTHVGSGASPEQKAVYQGLMKSATSYAGMLGEVFLMAVGPKAKALAKALVRDARKPPGLDQGTVDMVERSKRARESLLMIFDMGAFAKTGKPAQLELGVQFSSDRMQWRFSMQAAAARSLVP